MTDTEKAWKEPLLFLKEIEKKIEEQILSQKAEIEKELLRRIEKEKEEAERKIEAVSREFDSIKAALDEHKRVIGELQTLRDNIHDEIESHLNRAKSHRAIIATAVSQLRSELEILNGLEAKLGELRDRAAAKTEEIRSYLRKVGLSVDLPSLVDIEENLGDLRGETAKIGRLVDFVAAEKIVEPGEALRAEAEFEAVAAEEAAPVIEPMEAEMEIPAAAAAPIPETPGPSVAVEAVPEVPELEQVPIMPASEVEKAAEAEQEVSKLQEFVAPFRRLESAGNGLSFAYYEGSKGKVVDPESLVEAVDALTSEAEQMHKQLAKTDSLKEVFLAKQEILNKQEILRKIFFLAVKLCDKEGGVLPAYVADVFDFEKMKDFLERLTLGNWSDVSDFRVFIAEASGLLAGLREKLANPKLYLESVIAQL
jgi:hypothetical protein